MRLRAAWLFQIAQRDPAGQNSALGAAFVIERTMRFGDCIGGPG